MDDAIGRASCKLKAGSVESQSRDLRSRVAVIVERCRRRTQDADTVSRSAVEELDSAETGAKSQETM